MSVLLAEACVRVITHKHRTKNRADFASRNDSGGEGSSAAFQPVRARPTGRQRGRRAASAGPGVRTPPWRSPPGAAPAVIARHPLSQGPLDPRAAGFLPPQTLLHLDRGLWGARTVAMQRSGARSTFPRPIS